MPEQPSNPPLNQFTDALGNTCQLGDPTVTNSVQGSTVTTFNNQPIIVFNSPNPPLAPTNGYGFTYADPNDPSGTTYDVRWAVVITGSGGTPSSQRLILAVPHGSGNAYF